jgi:uncharacterized repeat protein (TIGR01451 family)
LRRLLGVGTLVGLLAIVFVGGAIALGGDDGPAGPGATQLRLDEGQEEQLLEQDLAFVTRRTAGDKPLDISEVGKLRHQAVNARNIAAKNAKLLGKEQIASGVQTFNSPWTALGPNPIVQAQRSDGANTAESGRIGALAIEPNGRFILGAAQGGIWTSDNGGATWTPHTDDQNSLGTGALAIAPSASNIVYAGTGEGALSGDSMFGDGVLKSTDGGSSWNQVSGDYFLGVSISRLVVDPRDPNHLYAAVLRGRGGARRTTPAEHSRYGVWESKDGGVSWNLLKEAAAESNGATDLEIDPQSPNTLYASFWGDAIYKSTDAGKHWSPIMNGFPAGADFADAQTRFSIGLSHPAGTPNAVLYAGFDYDDATGAHQAGRVWKSTDGGAHWSVTGAGTGIDSVVDYCGTQCFYDNVIEADPTNPNVVYAAGSFGYGLNPPSGGVFRSTDGGATWVNLGWDMHPDFHALAFDPNDTKKVLIGNDGGVWYSTNRGGRPGGTADPLSAVDWQDLNGGVTPGGVVTSRTGLQITQFTSIGTVPQVAPGAATGRFWGGTQDNGTLRKSVNSATWFDSSGGDGGQVIVDWTPDSCTGLPPSCFVYGSFFGISPYRFADGGGSAQFIRTGISATDRSDFYPPWVLNRLNPNQLFFGTQRLYRTDSARAPAAGDVVWKPVSDDLTTGCTGIAPNGARNCSISAIGVGGGDAAYVGTLDGLAWVSPDAQTSDAPTWTQLDPHGQTLPDRPVASIAVDPSNWQIAYIAYDGFSAATPTHPGHVFRTTDGGNSWTDVSGDLPDTNVNSIVLDPSYSDTLYLGADDGPWVSYNGGTNWVPLDFKSTFPNVGVWQIDLDPYHRVIAAGTHGRGAFKIADNSTPVPSLVLTKVDAGIPVGPSSNLDYTITLKNIGNADATGVTIKDPLPDNTSFVSADNGGTFADGVVTWAGLTVPQATRGAGGQITNTGGSVTVHLRVSIDAALKKHVDSIVDSGVTATSAQGPSTTGSPVVTTLAQKFGVDLSPASQTDGARVGTSASYHVTVTNEGFQSDTFNLSSSGGTYTVSLFDATCTTAITKTPTLAAGGTADVCVKVAVPTAATDGATSASTITATSAGNTSLSASGTLTTIAVTKNWLIVDNDKNSDVDVQSFYTAAANTVLGGSAAYSVWDIGNTGPLPPNYLLAHKYVIWFTGTNYPGPITPYEGELKAFLDAGGNLFMNGQDILDQGAGTTAFVHDYLHINWDGTEVQNDKATATVTAVGGNPVTGSIVGPVPINHAVYPAAFRGFEDRITPIAPAAPAFTDDTGQTDALTVSGTYKVVFLAFGFEEYGTAAQQADLLSRVKTFFGA